MATNELEQKINDILEIARFAPSVHNTQPWKVRVNGWQLLIELDPEHALDDGDPTGRETVISLGIFCQATIMAAEHLGFKLADVNFNSDTATIDIAPKKTTKPTKTSTENIS